MYKDLIKNDRNFRSGLTSVNPYSLDGFKQLITNCSNESIHTPVLTPFDLSLWLSDFLVDYGRCISFVSSAPRFELSKIESVNSSGPKPMIRIMDCDTKTFSTYEEMGEFFIKNKRHSLVVYSIIKVINMVDFSISFRLRYKDITDKDELRDKILDEILT